MTLRRPLLAAPTEPMSEEDANAAEHDADAELAEDGRRTHYPGRRGRRHEPDSRALTAPGAVTKPGRKAGTRPGAEY